MLAVTNTAKRHLHSYLDSASRQDVGDKCFRIVPTAHDQFLTLKLTEPKSDDETYSYEGTTVLAVPRSLQKVCQDRQLHINDEGKLFLS